jgi:carboxy-terminal domain RNA polymerase II polypeptide A small phosphatase
MVSLWQTLFSRITINLKHSISLRIKAKRFIVHQSAISFDYYGYMSSRKRKSSSSLSGQLMKHIRQYNIDTDKNSVKCENDITEDLLSPKNALNDNSDKKMFSSKYIDTIKSKPRMSRTQKKNRSIQMEQPLSRSRPDESHSIDNTSFKNVKCDNTALPDIPNLHIRSKNEKKLSKPVLSPFEKFQICVKELTAKKSGYIRIIDPSLSAASFTTFNSKKVQVVTTCLHPIDAGRSVKSDNDNSLTTIVAKPLLILDLNGILCHRLRNKKDSPILKPEEDYYRSPMAKIANTPIIPRPDLDDFLNFVDQHFALAIWTSAKSKNATNLVQTLVPEHIKARLLFVWAQHDCECDDPNVADPNFIKDLQKVWDKFPVWNERSTLLIDDSPEKCMKWKSNAIHPPPMNGLHSFLFRDDDSKTAMRGQDTTGRCKSQASNLDKILRKTISDESNVIQQMEFFHKLVQQWTANNVVQEWDSECDDACFITSNSSSSQVAFLNNHATGHMGWPQ